MTSDSVHSGNNVHYSSSDYGRAEKAGAGAGLMEEENRKSKFNK